MSQHGWDRVDIPLRKLSLQWTLHLSNISMTIWIMAQLGGKVMLTDTDSLANHIGLHLKGHGPTSRPWLGLMPCPRPGYLLTQGQGSLPQRRFWGKSFAFFDEQSDWRAKCSKQSFKGHGWRRKEKKAKRRINYQTLDASAPNVAKSTAVGVAKIEISSVTTLRLKTAPPMCTCCSQGQTVYSPLQYPALAWLYFLTSR